MAGPTGSGVDRGSDTWSTFPNVNQKVIDRTFKAQQTSWGQSPKMGRILNTLGSRPSLSLDYFQ
jgi:hypothetical protein